MGKPILCLDFDGVIHSYTSGWKGHDVIPDLPVPGSLEFIRAAVEVFDVQIYSSRSEHGEGVQAMKSWLMRQYELQMRLAPFDVDCIMMKVKWPRTKPPALVTIDDRALTFDGTWPDLDDLRKFQPWNKRRKPDHAGTQARWTHLKNGWTFSVAKEAIPGAWSVAAWPTANDQKAVDRANGDWFDFDGGVSIHPKTEVRCYTVDEVVNRLTQVSVADPPQSLTGERN